MGTFKTERLVPARADLGLVAEELCGHFSRLGYAVKSESSATGSRLVSISKGGAFKSVLGMKTALNIELEPVGEGVSVRASIGVFGQQAVPTALMLFVAWPVVITQIWGLVQQSKLDDEAVDFAERVILDRARSSPPAGRAAEAPAGRSAPIFCTECGARISAGAKFCGQCGAKAI